MPENRLEYLEQLPISDDSLDLIDGALRKCFFYITFLALVLYMAASDMLVCFAVKT